MKFFKLFVLVFCLFFLTSVVVFKKKINIYNKGWIDFNKNGVKDIFEDSTQTVDARVDDLLSQMTIEEKTSQMVTLYGYSRILQDELPTEEWKNSAGSYTIQGYGASFINFISGSYTSAVGLPLEKVYTILKNHKLL